MAIFVIALLSLNILLVVLIKRAKLRLQAYDDYNEADNLLSNWLEARPNLYIGQCPYAKGLVLRLIDAQLTILKFNSSEENIQCLESLYGLLDEQPPRKTPPGPKPPGGFFYTKRYLIK